MKRHHKSDDKNAEPKVHENVRTSTDGVEKRADRGSDAAAGLIGGGVSGKGEMVDPRYIAPR
jgi:hypothetical protein